MQAYLVPCWWIGWWLWRAGCISQDTYLLYNNNRLPAKKKKKKKKKEENTRDRSVPDGSDKKIGKGGDPLNSVPQVPLLIIKFVFVPFQIITKKSIKQ